MLICSQLPNCLAEHLLPRARASLTLSSICALHRMQECNTSAKLVAQFVLLTLLAFHVYMCISKSRMALHSRIAATSYMHMRMRRACPDAWRSQGSCRLTDRLA